VVVESMKDLLVNSKKRIKMGKEARKCAEENHSWEDAIKKFQKILDSIEIKDRSETWNRRPFIKILPQYKPEGMSHEQFVRWCYLTYLDREPEPEGFTNWMNNLAEGKSREDVESFFRNELVAHNKFEDVRWIKSLDIRGFKDDGKIVLTSNKMPGIIL